MLVCGGVDGGEGEDEGEERRVCRLEAVCVERKVERGLVRSIVYDVIG